LDRDVQVRRNRLAFPRAWVVHDVRWIRALDEAHPARRDALIARLRSGEPARPADPSTADEDLRRTAYVEIDDPATLASSLHEHFPEVPAWARPEEEVVTVREEAPTRVVIDAALQRSGLIVLADLFDSGWRLAIDGRPAPILRANLSMRAA